MPDSADQRERREVARLAIAVGLACALLAAVIWLRRDPEERLTQRIELTRTEIEGAPSDFAAGHLRRLLDRYPAAAPLVVSDVEAVIERMRTDSVLNAAEAAEVLAPPENADWGWTREQLVNAACEAIDRADEDELLFHVPAAVAALRVLAPDAAGLQGR